MVVSVSSDSLEQTKQPTVFKRARTPLSLVRDTDSIPAMVEA